ncbi:MAG: sugar ABC transporter permease [Lachnospiraceae bacterium]|nr:sugar ABC transporter permease [Lachnospiraceae bacterium]
MIIIFSLFLALILFNLLKKDFRGASFAKTSFLMPLIVPTGISVLFAQILFSNRGSINAWFGTQVDWLSTSPFTFWILVALYIWKNFGYFVIIFLVAYAAIKPEVYEAAKCDGAGSLRILASIILPQIIPSLFFVFIMSIVGVFKMNRESYLLYGNYPNESAYMFQNFIKNNLDNMNFSRAASAATIFLLIFSLLVFLLVRLSERAD